VFRKGRRFSSALS
jgi:hypothetical protein